MANIQLIIPSSPQETRNSNIRPGPTAKDYKKLDHRTHVYTVCDTYVGSDEKMERDEWIYKYQEENANSDDSGARISPVKMEYKKITVPQAVERIYLEILSNASDNVGKSRREGVDPGKIEITMTNRTISIKNGGLPIPIEMVTAENIYLPEMIFGILLTSSNYEVERHEAGRNGIGAKACNIFSTQFMIILHDAINHKKYTQLWTENMQFRSDPLIEEYNGDQSSTQVFYIMDFARFRYPIPEIEGGMGTPGGYPKEVFQLFARHAVDISCTTKVPVKFNEENFNMDNIRKYGKLYYGDIVKNAIMHYEWPTENKTAIIKKRNGIQISENPKITPTVEMLVVDTPDAGNTISFVNSMMTRDGGVHVTAAFKSVSTGIVDKINETMEKHAKKHKDDKEKRAIKINLNDVKPHISMVLMCRVKNPKFNSQSKTMLTSPTIKIHMDEDELKPIMRWQLVDRLYATLEAKQFNQLTKTDGRKKRHVRLLRGEDANLAGRARSHECSLFVTEGGSGMGYTSKMIQLIQGGRDLIGVLPLKGKSLNVMNITDYNDIVENNEICELKKILGLREGVDYLNDDNFATLRYGCVIIFADADDDGKHIIGLVLNIFHCRYPSLLARGYVMHYRTPIVRVSHGKTSKKFYFNHEYNAWKNKTSNYRNWTHKYYKGLGSSSGTDVSDDFQDKKIVKCYYDADAPAAMRLAFDKNMANQRKAWLAMWNPIIGVEDVEMQPISCFINYEFIQFSIADLQRSLPRFLDGLKVSQRKVLWAAMMKWQIGIKTKGDTNKKQKGEKIKSWLTKVKEKTYADFGVDRFACYVGENTQYHHGAVCLMDTIVRMCFNFVGTNNMPYFTQGGQFGTREKGGKDCAASRYIKTHPDWWIPYVFRKEDVPLLDRIIEDGDQVEPVTLLPIIPMGIINGIIGIGTGHSTTVPNHNPIDVVEWLKAKIMKRPLPKIYPWYRGFTGALKIIDRRKKHNILIENDLIEQLPLIENDIIDNENDNLSDQEDNDDPELEISSSPLLSMITLGKYEIDKKGKILITELPIGKSSAAYHKHIEDWLDEKLITDKNYYSVGDTVRIELIGYKGTPNYKSLRLQRSFGLTNMVFLTNEGKPVKFELIDHLLDEFYQQRRPFYERRRLNIMEAIRTLIGNLTTKIRFIRAIISGEIVYVNQKKSTILPRMLELNFPPELLNTIRLANLTEDDINGLLAGINQLEKDYQYYHDITAEMLWLNDLQEFETAYRKHYNT